MGHYSEIKRDHFKKSLVGLSFGVFSVSYPEYKGGVGMKQSYFPRYEKPKRIQVIESGGIKSVILNGGN